jgi:hypothetical protein
MDGQMSAIFGEVRQKAHDLVASTLLYFYENNKYINEIIFVPAAIFSRIIETHDSVGLLLDAGQVVDACIITLAQFGLRIQLAWTAHDIENASKWGAHADTIYTPRKIRNTIEKLYPESDERAYLKSIYTHLLGIKHGNPFMSDLVFPVRTGKGSFSLSTGTIEDEFSSHFSKLLREFSVYQVAWCSQVMNLYVAKYANVEYGLRERLRQIGLQFAPAEERLTSFMEEVTKRQQGFLGLRASRESKQ